MRGGHIATPLDRGVVWFQETLLTRLVEISYKVSANHLPAFSKYRRFKTVSFKPNPRKHCYRYIIDIDIALVSHQINPSPRFPNMYDGYRRRFFPTAALLFLILLALSSARDVQSPPYFLSTQYCPSHLTSHRDVSPSIEKAPLAKTDLLGRTTALLNDDDYLDDEIKEIDEQLSRLRLRRKELQQRKHAGRTRDVIEDARQRWARSLELARNVVLEWSQSDKCLVVKRGWRKVKDVWGHVLGRVRHIDNVEKVRGIMEGVVDRSGSKVGALRERIPEMRVMFMTRVWGKNGIVKKWGNMFRERDVKKEWKHFEKKAKKRVRKLKKRVARKSAFIYRGYVAPASAFCWSRIQSGLQNVYVSIPDKEEVISMAANMQKNAQLGKRIENAKSLYMKSVDVVSNQVSNVGESVWSFSKGQATVIGHQMRSMADTAGLRVLAGLERLVSAFDTVLYRVKVFFMVVICLTSVWLLSRVAVFLRYSYSVSHGLIDFLKRMGGFGRVLLLGPEEIRQGPVARDCRVVKDRDEAVLYLPLSREKRARGPEFRVRVVYEDDDVMPSDAEPTARSEGNVSESAVTREHEEPIVVHSEDTSLRRISSRKRRIRRIRRLRTISNEHRMEENVQDAIVIDD